MQSKKDKVLAEKIIGYCDKIETIKQRFGATFEQFNSDEAFQLAISMCIVQIGELAKRFSDDFRTRHAEISWAGIKGLRNIFVHEYEKIDFGEIWRDITKDVPKLQAQLEKILAEENDNGNRDA